MLRTARLTTLFLLFTLFSTPQNIRAESSAMPSPNVNAGDSVARLAQAVESLTTLLETQAMKNRKDQNLRKLDIAISYLNFRSRRIELLERDLSMTRNERTRYADMIQMWQDRQEQLLADMEEKSQEEQKELERAQKEFEMRVKGMEQRMATIEEEIIIRENRIAELQDQLDAVETYVQQHLNL